MALGKIQTKILLRVISFCASTLSPSYVSAEGTAVFVAPESVLSKVARTGTLVAGTSKDAFPYAYADEKGNLTGYSVDLLKLIEQQLETQLDREIELKLVAVDPDERIPKLTDREVDIVCDASSFTWERDRDVDFSISYGITGTRLLVKKDSNLETPESLADRQIGVLPATTNELSIRRAQSKAKIVTVSDRAEGYAALQGGKIDAFADDGILLESWLQTVDNAAEFKIVGDYSKEGVACMVPENNSDFLDSVNYTLVRFMQGFLEGKDPYVSLFGRWFGSEGAVPLTQDLWDLAQENMRLFVDFTEEIPDEKL